VDTFKLKVTQEEEYSIVYHDHLSNTEICTQMSGADICWVNDHSLISALFQLTCDNQCSIHVRNDMY